MSTDVSTRESIKEVLVKQFDEQHDTRMFYDEWFLHEVMKKEREYKGLLLLEKKPLELNPLVPTRYSFQVLVTPSSRKTGQWQVTIFKDSEPQGHKDYETFEDAIEDNISDWFNQGLWCWDNNDIEKGRSL